ncbi:hypothetical protein G7046_g8725 [Stylonectria norvegica]|nr:hypothetical protein G7046_g8725 [Stylonectria norvegica]
MAINPLAAHMDPLTPWIEAGVTPKANRRPIPDGASCPKHPSSELESKEGGLGGRETADGPLTVASLEQEMHPHVAAEDRACSAGLVSVSFPRRGSSLVLGLTCSQQSRADRQQCWGFPPEQSLALSSSQQLTLSTGLSVARWLARSSATREYSHPPRGLPPRGEGTAIRTGKLARKSFPMLAVWRPWPMAGMWVTGIACLACWINTGQVPTVSAAVVDLFWLSLLIWLAGVVVQTSLLLEVHGISPQFDTYHRKAPVHPIAVCLSVHDWAKKGATRCRCRWPYSTSSDNSDGSTLPWLTSERPCICGKGLSRIARSTSLTPAPSTSCHAAVFKPSSPLAGLITTGKTPILLPTATCTNNTLWTMAVASLDMLHYHLMDVDLAYWPPSGKSSPSQGESTLAHGTDPGGGYRRLVYRLQMAPLEAPRFGTALRRNPRSCEVFCASVDLVVSLVGAAVRGLGPISALLQLVTLCFSLFPVFVNTNQGTPTIQTPSPFSQPPASSLQPPSRLLQSKYPALQLSQLSSSLALQGCFNLTPVWTTVSTVSTVSRLSPVPSLVAVASVAAVAAVAPVAKKDSAIFTIRHSLSPVACRRQFLLLVFILLLSFADYLLLLLEFLQCLAL